MVGFGGALDAVYDRAVAMEAGQGGSPAVLAMYDEILAAPANAENLPAQKKALVRLVGLAGIAEEKLVAYQARLIGEHGSTLQEVIDAMRPDGVLVVPPGTYEETVVLHKGFTLRGADSATCVLMATADAPVIEVQGRAPVRIESLTVKSQLATSEPERVGCALLVKDGNAVMRACNIVALGNSKRCPTGILVDGFASFEMQDSQTVGYDFTIQVSGGAKGRFERCFVYDPGHCGITVYADSKGEIDGCVVTGSRYHGIRSTGGSLQVSHCLILKNQNRGIYLGNKSARGTIANNLLLGNGTGISGFAYSAVAIRNNVIVDSAYAAIDTRPTCVLSIGDNVIAGNERGFVVHEPRSRNSFRMSRNTFFNNAVEFEQVEAPSEVLRLDPGFRDAAQGDFSLATEELARAGQGLRSPKAIQALWQAFGRNVPPAGPVE